MPKRHRFPLIPVVLSWSFGLRVRFLYSDCTSTFRPFFLLLRLCLIPNFNASRFRIRSSVGSDQALTRARLSRHCIFSFPLTCFRRGFILGAFRTARSFHIHPSGDLASCAFLEGASGSSRREQCQSQTRLRVVASCSSNVNWRDVFPGFEVEGKIFASSRPSHCRCCCRRRRCRSRRETCGGR